MGVLDIVPAGVVSGKDVYKVFDYARENKFAIPAFNVTVSLAFSSKGSSRWQSASSLKRLSVPINSRREDSFCSI